MFWAGLLILSAISSGANSNDQPLFRRILVHFDLKGAPPKLDFYKQLFPLLKRLGATGVLMEYEDTFPFNGTLNSIKNSKFYYTGAEISQIINWATENQLTVTPLVQTFGHLQFLLRNPKFSSLGVGGDTICPDNGKGLAVIKELIRQMLALHPNSDEIHIGGDEADNVRFCLGAAFAGVQNLSLQHYKNVAKYINTEFGKKILVWNDMMQHINPEIVDNFGLHSLVEPVIWEYGSDLNNTSDFTDGSMANMNPFEFKWSASAFKGAGHNSDTFTDIQARVSNHQSWLYMVKTQETFKVGYRGLIVTGWQRFNYDLPLCEIWPIGIPSLALCLAVVQGKGLDAANTQARSILQCPPREISFENRDWTNCKFPGSSIVGVIEKSRNCTFDTPACANVMSEVAKEMGKVYPRTTVDEWICQHFKYRLEYVIMTCRDLTR